MCPTVGDTHPFIVALPKGVLSLSNRGSTEVLLHAPTWASETVLVSNPLLCNPVLLLNYLFLSLSKATGLL